MKRHQTGEVMLAVMVVIMVVMWVSKGHMGMMGHSGDHAEKLAEAVQTTPADAPAPKESTEHQH